MYCENCGKLIEEGNKFCPYCGTKLVGTEEKVEEVWAAIDSGELKVFDTSKWTVGGETITSTANLEGFNGVEYISPDGYFMESEIASAPAFSFVVDGITELNTVY